MAPGSNSARPYFRNVSNIAQTPVPDCGWLQLSAPALGTFYNISIFERERAAVRECAAAFSMAVTCKEVAPARQGKQLGPSLGCAEVAERHDSLNRKSGDLFPVKTSDKIGEPSATSQTP